MTKYHLEITGSAEKELRRYHRKLQDRIIKKIFSLSDARRHVKILDIGHRKEIYH